MEEQKVMVRARGINVGEVVVAVILILAGLYVAWEGTHYPVGTMVRMGPGFVPISLGILLSVVGVFLVISVARSDDPPPQFFLIPVAWACAGILVFALMGERFGLVPATVGMVVVSSFAERPVNPKTMVLLSVGLSLMGVLVFIEGLKLPLSIVRW